MAEPVIQTHQLTKIYRHPFFVWQVRARALTDLTFAIRRGEVFGLLGPNGSGKSTTIKILLGLLFPTKGQAAVFGKRPTDVAIKSRIGFLPEESYLYRFLDAEETLDFMGRLFRLPRMERKRRIEALLNLVGMWRERRRPVVDYSKGMQRRVGIAACLINDPELVILDEPTTGLDPLGTREVKDLILQLKEKGKTVLLSSHLLADVEDVCDRVTILYGGRMQAEGTLGDLLRHERLTQITAELDPDTLAKVVELIRERAPGREVDVQPPAERLEHFFLRIVKEAQEKRLATSGVDVAGARLDFLSAPKEDEGDGLLASLTRVEETATAATSAPAATVREYRDEMDSRLEALTKGEAEPSAPSAPVTVLASEPETDRSLLDRLEKDG